MPQPQLGAAAQPQLGAMSQPQLDAAPQPRRPLKRLFRPPKILQRGAHEPQLGAASQPQLGAAISQPQLGAGAAQPQLGATSQPQRGALKHEPKWLILLFSLLNNPARPQGSQLGATSQPQLGAATSQPQLGAASQPQLGAESQQPRPNRPAFAFDGANTKPATANSARKRTDIFGISKCLNLNLLWYSFYSSVGRTSDPDNR